MKDTHFVRWQPAYAILFRRGALLLTWGCLCSAVPFFRCFGTQARKIFPLGALRLCQGAGGYALAKPCFSRILLQVAL